MAEHIGDAHPMIIAPVTTEGIQAGDVVALRTGGPTMVVKARSQNLAYCAWTTDGRLHSGTFEVASLRFVTDTGQPGACGHEEPHLPCP